MQKIAEQCPNIQSFSEDGMDVDATKPPAVCSDLSLPEEVSQSISHLVGNAGEEIIERACRGLEVGRFNDRLASGMLLALLGDPRIRPGQVPQMVRVEGGQVDLGLPYEAVDEVVSEFSDVGVIREWIEKECPRYMIHLSPYRIATYPVTNSEYLAFLLDNPNSEIPSSWSLGRYPAEFANHPVFTVSEKTADHYCAWLSKKTGLTFRLPSEPEWECAAGSKVYPWGDKFHVENANTAESKINFTTPVGIYPQGRSWVGCFDMSGNVEEYTSSNYAPYPGGVHITDDLNRDRQAYRIARGGSFARYADLCRVTRRHGRYHSDLYAMGFRVAMDAS
ncbi:SUMF1/EgtB/PvdO family nonheme iron enzyme [Pseudovibrio sp. Ad37]|uniref:formylglycine-generating enzyme family protein n=1 Tax=Pseudovibrio sp. Ad37 TaxID=989422 RepID=UPI0007AE97CF|nr:SUMF1/EgtB/PvdO family nonheme iron enzyme [Pseudovibrio sp. Ad37]KZL15103.1 Serine/threonine-protein kinase pkn1 [Pseudovibrio sp. Ad37]